MAESVLHVVASVRVDGNFILEWDFTAYIGSIAPSRRYGVSFVLVLKIFALMVWLDLIVMISVLVLVDVLVLARSSSGSVSWLCSWTFS